MHRRWIALLAALVVALVVGACGVLGETPRPTAPDDGGEVACPGGSTPEIPEGESYRIFVAYQFEGPEPTEGYKVCLRVANDAGIAFENLLGVTRGAAVPPGSYRLEAYHRDVLGTPGNFGDPSGTCETTVEVVDSDVFLTMTRRIDGTCSVELS